MLRSACHNSSSLGSCDDSMRCKRCVCSTDICFAISIFCVTPALVRMEEKCATTAAQMMTPTMSTRIDVDIGSQVFFRSKTRMHCSFAGNVEPRTSWRGFVEVGCHAGICGGSNLSVEKGLCT